ncbi:MAG: hypothetical protein U0521_08190 [Anaerolineae bacterium]
MTSRSSSFFSYSIDGQGQYAYGEGGDQVLPIVAQDYRRGAELEFDYSGVQACKVLRKQGLPRRAGQLNPGGHSRLIPKICRPRPTSTWPPEMYERVSAGAARPALRDRRRADR